MSEKVSQESVRMSEKVSQESVSKCMTTSLSPKHDYKHHATCLTHDVVLVISLRNTTFLLQSIIAHMTTLCMAD